MSAFLAGLPVVWEPDVGFPLKPVMPARAGQLVRLSGQSSLLVTSIKIMDYTVARFTNMV